MNFIKKKALSYLRKHTYTVVIELSNVIIVHTYLLDTLINVESHERSSYVDQSPTVKAGVFGNNSTGKV